MAHFSREVCSLAQPVVVAVAVAVAVVPDGPPSGCEFWEGERKRGNARAREREKRRLDRSEMLSVVIAR